MPKLALPEVSNDVYCDSFLSKALPGSSVLRKTMKLPITDSSLFVKMLKIMADRNHSTLMIMAIVMSSLIYPIHSLLSPSDAEAAENISMTLTELSVFMKKQELELQLRTEKEKEEGEYLWQLAAPMSADTF